jgi:hypothetical protein
VIAAIDQHGARNPVGVDIINERPFIDANFLDENEALFVFGQVDGLNSL